MKKIRLTNKYADYILTGLFIGGFIFFPVIILLILGYYNNEAFPSMTFFSGAWLAFSIYYSHKFWEESGLKEENEKLKKEIDLYESEFSRYKASHKNIDDEIIDLINKNEKLEDENQELNETISYLQSCIDKIEKNRKTN